MRKRSIPGWGVGIVVACAGVLSALAQREGPAKPEPSDDLFTNAIVRHLRIEISEEGMATLRVPVPRSRAVSQRPDVPATVREGNKVWTNVAVHLKGSLGSFRPVNDKPALTLNFDKFAEGQRFHGLQKISLNNSVQDPSYVNEKVCREVFAAAGIPVPRADYATVELNGRHLGLFVLVEGWNKQFLRRHFGNVKGNFYDPGNSREINTITTAAFGDEPTNNGALLAVWKAANEPDHTKRLARLKETLDLDRFLMLHALDVMMWNWDGYALNRNNYRVFHDAASDRIAFLPHGLDQMFWKPDGPIMTGRSGFVAKSILETAEGRRLYLEHFRRLRARVFDERALTNRVASLTARLRPALAKEGRGAVVQQQAAANEFIELISARARDVDSQLVGVNNLLVLALNESVSLTNWVSHRELGLVSFTKTENQPIALRIHVNRGPVLGMWTTVAWLEEGRYRIEGRVKTLAVQNDGRSDAGAGFRVWSSRKETRGTSWGWFPYASTHDTRMGGMIPVFTNTPQQRLTRDTDWTNVTHEFELRQPMADLQIQCVLDASAGAAWFDLSSLKIRRVALTVSKSVGRGD